MDSFEIGTESAICEDCGEIHGLDEYEEVVKSGKQIYGEIVNFGNIGSDGKKTVDFDKCRECQNKKFGKKACLKNHCPFTSEPIPDYIMRALQPKKSVHSVYGNLRY